LPLFDSGEADGFLYYVMPFVEGETLHDWLDREKQLPVGEAVRIAVAVAGALAYAHEHGVVHRDIKPGNILIQAGQPVVGDFGIALAVGAAGGARLTETGLSVGTPYYMSPEQATGDMSVGPASDIYALGAVLFELLTGDPPYMGNTAQAVLGKILQGIPVSATAVRRSIPVNVDAAIRKSLEKLPADRFTSASDFAKALEDPSFRHGDVAESAGGKAGLWNPVSIGASALATVLAVVAVWALLRPEPTQPVMRLSLNPGDNPFPSEWIGLSPDATVMVSSRPDEAGNWGLYLRRFSDWSEVQLPGVNQPVNDPTISPDGTEVAYFDSGVLKVSPLSGGLIRTLAEDANCCGRWGGDGYFYYAAQDGSIHRVPVSGGISEEVFPLGPDDQGGLGYYHPIPGTEKAIFSVFSTPSRTEAIDLSNGERHVISPGLRSYLTKTGHLVFATDDGRLMAAPFDRGDMVLAGPAVPIIEGMTIRNGDAAYSLADDGTLLYWRGPASSSSAEFVWINRNGAVTPVDPGWSFSPGAGNFGWSLSPDGTRLAFRDNADDPGEVWVKELDDGPLSRLTFDPGFDSDPIWSPDGRSILFLSARVAAGHPTVWSRRADGTGEPQLVLDPERAASEIEVSPDGEWIVMRTGDAPSRDILAQRPGVDSVATPLLASPDFDEAAPAISPDGRWLAYGSNETGGYQIYVRPFPDVESGRWQVSTSGGAAPRWSHRGDEIFYGTATGAVMAARVDTSSGFRVLGTQTLFTDNQVVGEGIANGWYDISADDERFLMARPVSSGGAASDPELILVQNFLTEVQRLAPN
ncbi:MAG: protein kinase, partial [Gemmatimonadota bacterium]